MKTNKSFKGYQLFCHLNGLADGQYINFKKIYGGIK